MNKKMQNDFRVLFVGGIFPKELERDIIRKSSNNVELAANNFQWDLISGFDKVLKNPVTILNNMYIGSYPKNYSDWLIRQEYFEHTKGARDINLGFINVSIIKQFIRPFSEKKHIKKWVESNKESGVVFIYSLNPRFIRISKYIKKISPMTPIIVSVMDLPEHILKSKKRSIIVDTYRRINTLRVHRGIKYIDGLMLVAENQKLRLPSLKSNYVVVEALTNNAQDFTPIRESKTKKIVYAGTLAKQYNILNLLEAFKTLNRDDVELHICGEGEAREDIVRASAIDARIHYHGVLPKIETGKLMRDAWVLVNPRENSQEFTQFSFPSKTIEYLLSGRPVVSQKLDGIPEEYNKHLIYFESSPNNSDLVKVLSNVLDRDLNEINRVGASNHAFASVDKSSVNQISKIIDLYSFLLNRQEV